MRPGGGRDILTLWFYGAPGSGKSYTSRIFINSWFAKERPNETPTYHMVQHFKWLDGYQDGDPALIDDFRVNDLNHAGFQLNHLLIMLGPFSILKETKGGHVLWNPPLIIVTSCFHPVTAFGGGALRDGDDIGQLIRRLHAIIRFERITLELGQHGNGNSVTRRWVDETCGTYADHGLGDPGPRHAAALSILHEITVPGEWEKYASDRP